MPGVAFLLSRHRIPLSLNSFSAFCLEEIPCRSGQLFEQQHVLHVLQPVDPDGDLLQCLIGHFGDLVEDRADVGGVDGADAPAEDGP